MLNIRELREKKGIKQEELASYLGMSVANYSKKETGQIRFSLIEAKKLSIYFGLSIEKIFFK